MLSYSGKCKCSCGKRAKWKAVDGIKNYFACDEHRARIEGKHNPRPDDDRMTEADYQTWTRL